MAEGLREADYEAAGDLRTPRQPEPTSVIRRMLTAATAGGLALLGTGGAYLGLCAGYVTDLGTPRSLVPVLHLLMITIGLPLVAAVAGWLLAGREPTSLTRQPIE